MSRCVRQYFLICTFLYVLYPPRPVFPKTQVRAMSQLLRNRLINLPLIHIQFAYGRTNFVGGDRRIAEASPHRGGIAAPTVRYDLPLVRLMYSTVLYCTNTRGMKYRTGTSTYCLLPALPCPALPCPALPCPALPCPDPLALTKASRHACRKAYRERGRKEGRLEGRKPCREACMQA